VEDWIMKSSRPNYTSTKASLSCLLIRKLKFKISDIVHPTALSHPSVTQEGLKYREVDKALAHLSL
jgi:hypothetical protein